MPLYSDQWLSKKRPGIQSNRGWVQPYSRATLCKVPPWLDLKTPNNCCGQNCFRMRHGYRKNPYPYAYFIGSRFARNSTSRDKIRRIIRRQTWHGRLQYSRHPGRWKKSRTVGLFTLTYPEHLGAAGWADTLGSRPAIFHGYFLRVFHFSLGFAFDTISFHLIFSFNFYFVKPFAPQSL